MCEGSGNSDGFIADLDWLADVRNVSDVDLLLKVLLGEVVY